MDRFYLLDDLKKDLPQDKLDLLKYELDQRIYYYGRYFKQPKEKVFTINEAVKFFLKNSIRQSYAVFSASLPKTKKGKAKRILSDAYFTVNQELARAGCEVFRPLHAVARGEKTVGNFSLAKEYFFLNKMIRRGNFNQITSPVFLEKIDSFIDHLATCYRELGLDALIVPNDIAFFEQLNIAAFKKINKPTFIFLHGLPGRYNSIDDNQTDYLILWGDKIKDNYVQAGISPDKIILSGHPYYKSLTEGALRNSLDDVLVVTKSLNGSQFRDAVRLIDRGNMIIYLNQVERALKACGVKRARFRVHPSESAKWYKKFINNDFFVVDDAPLAESLQRATLVVGATSTLFLESLYHGVNYLIYEPVAAGLDLSGYPLVAPFDNSDQRAPVFHTEEELVAGINSGVLVDKGIFVDYIRIPFDLSGVIDKI